MNYKEVRELAEAGFPMPERHGNLLRNPDCNGCAEVFWGAHKASSNCLLIEPILEELIEACGDRLRLLSNGWHNGIYTTNTWYAGHVEEYQSFTSFIEGSTPTEAVARLWLALNPMK